MTYYHGTLDVVGAILTQMDMHTKGDPHMELLIADMWEHLNQAKEQLQEIHNNTTEILAFATGTKEDDDVIGLAMACDDKASDILDYIFPALISLKGV
jgi:hypothetical protein